MKDKKIFILIAFAGIIIFILLFASRPAGKDGQQPDLSDITRQANIAQLESQVQQLRGLITAFVGLNQSFKASFQEEKEQRSALQQALSKASLQNESLSQELNRAKVGLELTLPIKQGIDKIQGSLSGLSLAPGKEKEISRQLADISRQLKLVDAQIPGLLKENASYKQLADTMQGLLKRQEEDISALKSALDEEKAKTREAKNTRELSERKSTDFERVKNNLITANASLHTEINQLTRALKDTRGKLSQAAMEKEANNTREAKTLRQDNRKLHEQLNQLQEQLARLQKDSEALRDDYAAARETLKNNEASLGSRADKILVLEETLAGIRGQLSEIQSLYGELEKESAILREQSVAGQLEREDLKSQLSQSRLKLSGLENRLSQIGVILETPKPAEATLPKEEARQDAKRVEVELYPAETITQETDK
jgi:chromosome segregation ATPase